MKYLVTMELIGAPPDSPQELIQHLEEKVIPTHEALMKLEVEKKILAGGDISGRRGNAFILELASNEELSTLLMSLPAWGNQKVDVIPLESFEERQVLHRKFLERLKATVK